MDSVTLAKIQEVLSEIDELIGTEQYEEAAVMIDENRLFLQKNADMKSQNLLNKNYAKCMFYITRNAYTKERDEKKFKMLFDKNRSLIEVHHSKADYLHLLKIYDRMKKRKKHKIFWGVVVSVLLIAVGTAALMQKSGLVMTPIKVSMPKFLVKEKKELAEAKPVSDGENREVTATDTGEGKMSSKSVDAVYAEETMQENVDLPEKAEAEDGYILDSASRLLTSEDVEGMSAQEIRMAVNEIYARHGHRFQGYNQEYFESKSWYVEDPTKTVQEIAKGFSDIERRNMAFLLKREKQLKGN